MESDWIVLMGARVRMDGQPSQTLIRGVRKTAELALLNPGAKVLASGGRRGSSYSEAEVAARLLREAGIESARILEDSQSWKHWSRCVLSPSAWQ